MKRSVRKQSWAEEAGADIVMGGGWLLQTSVFARQDDDVIDWLRATTAERWQTYNVRDVSTLGFEVGVQKTLSSGAFLHAQYTALDLDAATVNLLSKYVLDYAPHSVRRSVPRFRCRLDFASRRGLNIVADRDRPGRPTTCCSTHASEGESTRPSISSSMARICSM